MRELITAQGEIDSAKSTAALADDEMGKIQGNRYRLAIQLMTLVNLKHGSDLSLK